jgi:hypothetical protein
MTEPKIKTYTRNYVRWYEHPLADDPPDRTPFSPLAIGVSGVLDVLNKRALSAWMTRMAAEFAVDHHEQWMPLPTRAAKVDLIKGASRYSAGEKADLGTAAHAVCEQLANHIFLGGAKPEIPDGVMPFAKTFLRFLKEMKAEATHLEQTVWNHTLGYAGTFDGIYNLDGRPVMIDTKTGASGIWAETALQQVAYINAEVIVHPEGSEIPMPKLEGAYALWLRPEGYALHPLVVDENTWRCFQALLTAKRWKDDVGQGAIRKPINPAPLRK